MSDSNNLPPTNPKPRASAQVTLDSLLKEVGTANPQELLGAAAHTSLTAAMVQATVITAVVLAGLTFGPMLWAGIAGPAAAAKAVPAPQEPAAKVEPAAPAATTKPETPAKSTPDAKPPVSKEALDKLGVNEIKKTDPKTNPLEKANDDILKDLDRK